MTRTVKLVSDVIVVHDVTDTKPRPAAIATGLVLP